MYLPAILEGPSALSVWKPDHAARRSSGTRFGDEHDGQALCADRCPTIAFCRSNPPLSFLGRRAARNL